MKLKKVKKKVLSGGKLAGGNPENGRVEYDYYATNPLAVSMLMDKYKFRGKTFLEPCVGEGHIAKEVLKHMTLESTFLDIVDRGYENTIVTDFLQWETDKKFDIIITNPPYSLAKDFVEKSLSLLNKKGQIAMFLKIQFLESDIRKVFFKNYPPKYIYVFSDRMPTWNNGNPVNPKTGKKWQTTFCHAWFIWEKDSVSEPVIRWL